MPSNWIVCASFIGSYVMSVELYEEEKTGSTRNEILQNKVCG